MQTREDKILSKIDYTNSSLIGVEIGALNNPIITRNMGNIRYIDHVSTDVLKVKYADDSKIDSSKQIVDVDYVWGEKTLVELTKQEAPFDYLIACHVIEHVPDIVGWLQEIHNILKSGGVLSLAIPDKRNCFDYNRNVTQLGDVLESYLTHSRKPTPKQVFDSHSQSVTLRNEHLWVDKIIKKSELAHTTSMVAAWNRTKAIFESNAYDDVHCWVFTPRSFFSLLEGLAELNLLQFEPIQFHPTAGHEFFVTLKAVDDVPCGKIGEFVSQTIENLECENLRHVLSEFYDYDSLIDEITNLSTHIEAMKNTKFWKVRESLHAIKHRLKSYIQR